MLSEDTARELEKIAERSENGRVIELQSPEGRTFSVYVQQGRSEQLQEFQKHQAERAGNQPQQRQREWRIRVSSTSQQQERSQQ